MKKYLTILLSLVPLWMSATTYYVQDTSMNVTYGSTASDANAGTNILLPWATLQKAFSTADAGDTVFMRGGSWYPTSRVQHTPPTIGHNGTYANHIVFINYPGETPILDCINYTSTWGNDQGITFTNSDYVELVGLIVQNCLEKVYDQYIAGIDMNYIGTMWFTRCTSRFIGGHGFQPNGYDTLYVTDCDVHDCCDSISATPGNRADGFTGGSGGADADTFKVAYYTGCRAWNISDDGFEIGTSKQVHHYFCWAFNNGYSYYPGALSGGACFKYGPSNIRLSNKRTIKNCLGIFSLVGSGITHVNLQDTLNGPVNYAMNSTFYKTTGLSDGIGDWSFSDYKDSTGQEVYKNILSFESNGNSSFQFEAYFLAYYGYPHHVSTEASTWVPKTLALEENSANTMQNPAYNITDADFTKYLSTDSALIMAELTAPRRSDGKLPELTYFRLSGSSEAYAAGVDVGMSPNPPLGIDWADVYENYYGDSDTSDATDILTFVLTEQTGAATIDTSLHTVSIEIEWDADITDLTPAITVSAGATIDPLSGVSRNFTTPQTYTVTAEDEVTEQVWTVTVTQEEEPEDTAPVVSTTAATDITSKRARTGGNVTSDGGNTVTERGVCYSTSANPTTANDKVTVAGTTGSFAATITGLSSNTTYHVRAYATNSVDTGYGADESFTTREWGIGKSGSVYVFSGGYIIKIE